MVSAICLFVTLICGVRMWVAFHKARYLLNNGYPYDAARHAKIGWFCLGMTWFSLLVSLYNW